MAADLPELTKTTWGPVGNVTWQRCSVYSPNATHMRKIEDTHISHASTIVTSNSPQKKEKVFSSNLVLTANFMTPGKQVICKLQSHTHRQTQTETSKHLLVNSHNGEWRVLLQVLPNFDVNQNHMAFKSMAAFKKEED